MKYIVIDAMSNTELDQPQILLNTVSLKEKVDIFSKIDQYIQEIFKQDGSAVIELTLYGAINDDVHNPDESVSCYIQELDDEDIDSFEDITMKITNNNGVILNGDKSKIHHNVMLFEFTVPYGEGEVFTTQITKEDLFKMAQLPD